jgi:glycosyltransferase involved in cell wall biosynthesis
MRCFVPASEKHSTGKGHFCNRLYDAMVRLEMDVVKKPSVPHDVSLLLIKPKPTAGKRKVVRLDGVNYSTTSKANRGLASLLHSADGVIYQSEFSKKMCDKCLGKFKGLKAVIFNGADPSYYDSITPAKVGPAVITSARWRPQKRLRDIIESFLMTDVSHRLFVAGDLAKSGLKPKEIRKYKNTGRVVILKVIDQGTLASYLKSSSAFVHLSWVDWCPNGVVEALSAGLPVVCNNVGGTQELVRPSGGIVCDIDEPYSGKPYNLGRPPKIDREVVACAIETCCKSPPLISNDHVNILKIAQEYYDFFGRVRRGK